MPKSQLKLLFHEILHLREPLVASLTFFHFGTKQGRASWKNHPVPRDRAKCLQTYLYILVMISQKELYQAFCWRETYAPWTESSFWFPCLLSLFKVVWEWYCLVWNLSLKRIHCDARCSFCFDVTRRGKGSAHPRVTTPSINFPYPMFFLIKDMIGVDHHQHSMRALHSNEIVIDIDEITFTTAFNPWSLADLCEHARRWFSGQLPLRWEQGRQVSK